MKTVRLPYNGKKFDNQYTFDLQNNLSCEDFKSIIGLFNQALKKNSPPPSIIACTTLLTVSWSLILLIFFIFFRFQIETGIILLLLLASLLSSSLLLYYVYLTMTKQFEKSNLDICNRVNATENIRGIHFRFFKNGEDINQQKKVANSYFTTKVTYEIIIEVDDRFNVLKSRQFNKRTPSEEFGSNEITYPPAATVHFHQHYQENDQDEDMFNVNDHPPAWSPPSFDEKADKMV